jgi:type IV secretory pathway TraG/TraD family ATPase VirD4
MSWGPSHQQPPSRAAKTGRRWLLLLAGFVAFASPLVFHLLIWAGLVAGCLRVRRGVRRLPRPALARHVTGQVTSGDPLELVRRWVATNPAGLYLGVGADGGWRFSRPQRAVLVLGPPRSGKTSAVIVPALLAHPGPAVSTSTKPDVLAMTAKTRSQAGQLWHFDPTGTAADLPGVERLRWSPLECSRDWDGALLMARAMVTGAGVGTGTTDGTHWSKRAVALLAPLLHAAATAQTDIGAVLRWVVEHDLDTPGRLLEQADDSPVAVLALTGVRNTETRERSSILSAAADALEAYTSEAALRAASEPNFHPGSFALSADTIYIHAPAESQHLAAPLVCGLLSAIRGATYRHHANGILPDPVLFALDEVANIAPLAELPAIASEGGGQGLILLAALQDLSQARVRWGTAADGFLTLFGTKLVLPGVADQRTLENISVTLGEYDRQIVSTTLTRVPRSWQTQRGQTVSTQRTRVLSPGEIANIPAGRALHLDGVAWELLTLTPAFSTEPWRSLTQVTR